MKKLLFVIAVLCSGSAFGAADIYADPVTCLVSPLDKLQIGLKVDGQSYSLQQDCWSSFDKSFVTSSGDTCRVWSAMCAFGFSSQIEIQCQQSGYDRQDIQCKDYGG